MTDQLCMPEHREGNRPYLVPLAGCVSTYVVYHGADYLDANGDVDKFPDLMSEDEARNAVRLHREACEVADEVARSHRSETASRVA